MANVAPMMRVRAAPCQAASALSSAASFRAQPLSVALSAARRTQKAAAMAVQAAAAAAGPVDTPERFRLNNLSPQPGSRRANKRKGRGHAAGQGASCGFGMRGQKSRSGPGVRPGFEGGQMPLYRRLPKLKGIAGGMGAGLPKYVTVNLDDISSLELMDGSEVSLEALVDMRLLNPSGRDRRLLLKVLGDGEIATKLTVKAGAFSAAARAKLEAAGCTLVQVPGRAKFVGAAQAKRQQRTADFFASKQAAT